MTAGGPGAGRLLVVGAGSFIARNFLAACEEPVSAVGHDALDRPDLLDGIGRVISFARHSLLGSERYRVATMDFDVRLAARVAGRETAERARHRETAQRSWRSRLPAHLDCFAPFRRSQ